MTADSIITLIGMPGSGKSTVSAVLAEQLGLEVVDADGLIEAQEKQTLQQIMSRLCAASTVVYLRATFETIEYRVSLAPQRGISLDSGQTLQDLYQERVPLYERYGEIVVDCDEATPEEIALSIRAQLPATHLN